MLSTMVKNCFTYKQIQSLRNLKLPIPTVKEILLESKQFNEKSFSKLEKIWNGNQIKIVRSGGFIDIRQRVINALQASLNANCLIDLPNYSLERGIISTKLMIDSGGGFTKLDFQFICHKTSNLWED